MEEDLSIRVSRMGPAEPVLGDPPTEELERHIDDLPYVDIPAPPNSTLGSSIGRAGTLMGFPEDFTPSYLALHDPGSSTQVSPLLSVIVLVNSQGRATFAHHWPNVRLDSALRAHNAGALQGDPTHLVFVPYHGFGDGALIEWGQAITAGSYLWNTLQGLAALYGTYQFLSWISDAFRKRVQAEQRQYLDWRDRGALPHDIHGFINQRSSWDSEMLAALLGCSENEAEAFLVSKGFVWNDTKGAWERPMPTVGEAGLAKNLDELILWSDLMEGGGGDVFKQYTQRMVEEYLTQGRLLSPLDIILNDGGE